MLTMAAPTYLTNKTHLFKDDSKSQPECMLQVVIQIMIDIFPRSPLIRLGLVLILHKLDYVTIILLYLDDEPFLSGLAFEIEKCTNF